MESIRIAEDIDELNFAGWFQYFSDMKITQNFNQKKSDEAALEEIKRMRKVFSKESSFEIRLQEENQTDSLNNEEFIHFSTCLQRLGNALVTLNSVKVNAESELVTPAFQYALVEYATAYTDSHGKQKHRPTKEYIPAQYLELHKRILNDRHTFHAHSDLTILEANVTVTETLGNPSATITGKYIDPLKELRNIDQIISLIEDTRQNMYAVLGNKLDQLHS